MAEKILALIAAFVLGVGTTWFVIGKCLGAALRHAPSIRQKVKDFIRRIEETEPTPSTLPSSFPRDFRFVGGPPETARHAAIRAGYEAGSLVPMFTHQEILIILRNLGHDVECGACMAIAFTGVGLPDDEHTCEQPLGTKR